MSHRRAAYVILAVLLALAFGHRIRHSIDAIGELSDSGLRVQLPFQLERAGPTVRSVRPEAAEAGLEPGDVVVAVNGRPLRGEGLLDRLLRETEPGATLYVRVRHGAEDRYLSIPLQTGRRGPFSGTAGRLFGFFMNLAMPWFCLLVGFRVALARPLDRQAWLLLALMIAFAHRTGDPRLLTWEDWLRPASILFHSFWSSTWALWVFLFGLYFPHQLEWERRNWWFKWTVLAPVGALAALAVLGAYSGSEDYRLAAGLDGLNLPTRRVLYQANLIPLALFFVFMGIKWVTERDSDARRRLKLLFWGSLVSVAPTLLFAFSGPGRPRPGMSGGIPPGLLLPALSLMFLFPLMLAYVIVVQRAMDIRVVLRQSVQYAFAKRGLWALRVGGGMLIIWSAVSLTGHERLTGMETVAVGAGAAVAVLVTRRASERVAGWVDRRFFREAYDTEQILVELSEEVRTLFGERAVVETVARCLSESMHVPRVAFFQRSNGAFVPSHAVGYEAPIEAGFQASSALARHLLRQHRPLHIYPEDERSWIYLEGGLPAPEIERLRDLAARLVLPLTVKEKLLGYIILGEKRSEEPYSRSDLRLLEPVMTQTALALENSLLTAEVAAEVARRERLNRELEIARQVQQRLFPQTLPPIQGLDYAGYCRPAEGVGGDYYDFMALPQGNLGLAIADVSGKGVPAALLMASLQASLRGQTIGGLTDLRVLMANLNRLTHEATPSNHFATYFYGQYCAATRTLIYVNAGHNPPMLWRAATGRIERLETGGTVIGAFSTASYEQASLLLQPGDVLLAFTDGINEATNAGNEEFGDNRLAECLQRGAGLPPGDLIQTVLDAVDHHAAGAPQHDDLTLVVARAV